MALLLYVPVLHDGYLQLFERQKKEKTLYLLGEELIQKYPLLAREIRRVEPEKMAQILRSTKLFDRVLLATPTTLMELNGKMVTTTAEFEMGQLVKRYLPKSKVLIETSFLRWDTHTAMQKTIVSPDLIVSKANFDRKMMNLAGEQAANSSDWFRQVGAVLVVAKKPVLTAFNRRQPTEQAAYSEGDPRNFIELGTDTHLRLVIHAEQAVIAEAAKQGLSTNGASLYVTIFPCPDCAAVIAASGISCCYYSGGYAQLDGQKVLVQAGVKLIKVE